MKNFELTKKYKSFDLFGSLIIALSIIISGYMVSSAIKDGFKGTMGISGDVEIRGDVEISTGYREPIEVSGDFYAD
jgi:hypothetical protein